MDMKDGLPATVRYFLGVGLDRNAAEALHEACRRLNPEIPFSRWTLPDDYHVTVKFIGDVQPSVGTRIEQALPDCLREGEAAPFSLALGGFGAFGPKEAPSILWCALRNDGGEPLWKLRRAGEEAAYHAGIARDTRPFRPHITAARKFRGAVPYSRAADRLPQFAPEPVEWNVNELILYRTRFGQRPAYEAVRSFPLM